MYVIVRTIIDDFLMGPQLAPFTTFGIIILIWLAATAILTPSDENIDLGEDV